MRLLAFFSILFVLGLSAAIEASEDPAEKLKELEAQIKKNRTDPMLYYRKAQCLMKLKKYEEGSKTAKIAMKRFILKKDDLAWMLLEQIDLDNVRVDVHFNMGPGERKPPRIGIVKPLSFRIWSKGEDPQLKEIIDFEIGFLDGKPTTAALGQTTPQGHGNFGILDTAAKYEEIRKKALELIKSRHTKP